MESWNLTHKTQLHPLELIIVKLQHNKDSLIRLHKVIESDDFTNNFNLNLKSSHYNHTCSFCCGQNESDHEGYALALSSTNNIIFNVYSKCVPYMFVSMEIATFFDKYILLHDELILNTLSLDVIKYIGSKMLIICTSKLNQSVHSVISSVQNYNKHRSRPMTIMAGKIVPKYNFQPVYDE